MEKTRTKKCSKCGEEFPATCEFFHINKQKKYGVESMCKSCKNEYGYELRTRRGGPKRVIVSNLPGEEWLPVVDYEEWYSVSNLGRVKRTKAGRATFAGKIIKQRVSRKGYMVLHLTRNSVSREFRVHCLVAAAFIGPRSDKMQINHIDGQKDNNHANNLEYVTQSENMRHAFDLGLRNALHCRGRNNHLNVLTEEAVLEIYKLAHEGKIQQRRLGKMFGVHQATIRDIKFGKSWGWLTGAKNEEGK